MTRECKCGHEKHSHNQHGCCMDGCECRAFKDIYIAPAVTSEQMFVTSEVKR